MGRSVTPTPTRAASASRLKSRWPETHSVAGGSRRAAAGHRLRPSIPRPEEDSSLSAAHADSWLTKAYMGALPCLRSFSARGSLWPETSHPSDLFLPPTGVSRQIVRKQDNGCDVFGELGPQGEKDRATGGSSQPRKRTSGSRRTPNWRSTSSCTCSITAWTSADVAPPRFTTNPACFLETAAPPTW